MKEKPLQELLSKNRRFLRRGILEEVRTIYLVRTLPRGYFLKKKRLILGLK